jgi:hypothetical protein
LNRIDIHIEVPAVKYKELRAETLAVDSAAVRTLGYRGAVTVGRALSWREGDLFERADAAENASPTLRHIRGGREAAGKCRNEIGPFRARMTAS